ncbi:hypothetical protein ACEWY4_023509 [Coilia grayii]|uniref:Multidrug resistance-associated protein 4-like n=1 Tax=Coilia grayii TaxID=363190 RepID=A0ABD1J384_9TELE
MVRCGLQCTAPIAFPPQLIHKPWNTQVAVMTEEARLVLFHSLETVAPMMAPKPTNPANNAHICLLDILQSHVQVYPLNEVKSYINISHTNKSSCWLNPLFRVGCTQRLQQHDMYQVLPEDGSEWLGERLQKLWDKEVQQAAKDFRSPKLSKVLIQCYWRSYAVFGVYTFIEEVIKVIQPLLLGKLIQYFEGYDPDDLAALHEAYGYAVGISITTIGLAALHHLYFYHVQRAGMKIRVAMCHMIYRKVSLESFMGKTAAHTDSRIRIMNEVVSGIRIIKMYAWEKPFSALVSEVRRKEISNIMNSSYLRGLNMAAFYVASKIIVFITFAVYVLMGNEISSSSVFVVMSLFGAVRITITLFFPSGIEKVAETRISVKRIKTFLLLDEIGYQTVCLPVTDKAECMVEIQDLICYWDKTLDAPTLQNVSFSVKSEQLLAIIGPVGAGKSSLLSTILGELPQERGVVKVKGELTYASQQPWIFPGTIRSNILFGKDLNPQKYERVLRACALKRDMELLPEGDLEVVGDRGSNLSGGQKARVNLARAVYQDADIYLLDDPLSAVDAEVGKHLFEQCICGVLRKKPRILVTHQLQYLKAADQILVLKEGHMVARGTYSELLSSGVDFTSLLKREEEDEVQSPEPGHEALGTSPVSCALSQSSAPSRCSSVLSVMDAAEHCMVERTVKEESRSEGTVAISLYVKYYRAGANMFVLLVLVLLNLLAHITYVLQDWWLAFWASKQEHLNVTQSILNGHNATQPILNGHNATRQLDLDLYLGVYAGLTGAAVLFGFLRSLLFLGVLVRAAQALHNRMFSSILRTPVLFFDVNPIGEAHGNCH